MDPVTALDQSYDAFAGVVKNLGPSQLTASTGCGSWDVRALLNHAYGAATMFTLVNEGVAVGEDGGDLVGNDPASALSDIRQRNVASWQSPGALEGDRTYPFGVMPAPGALMINVGEILVHGWDVARATNQTYEMDTDASQLVLDFYQQVPLDDFRQHGAFGPEVQMATSAPVCDRLLGLLGRQP